MKEFSFYSTNLFIRLILYLFILLPQLARAQFKPGSYLLTTDPTTVHKAELKLKKYSELLVKDGKNEKLTLHPGDVLYFRLGKHKFVTEDVEASEGLFGTAIQRQFVELLDSGQVILTHQEYSVGNQLVLLYLFRSEQYPTVKSLNFGDLKLSKKIQQVLLPYVASRPDLTEVVAKQYIDERVLRVIIRALNSGQPFVRPEPIKPFGVD